MVSGRPLSLLPVALVAVAVGELLLPLLMLLQEWVKLQQPQILVDPLFGCR